MSNKEDMAMDDRWTIRRVSGEARKQVEELHMLTGIPYGRLVSEAITIWYNQFQTSKRRAAYTITSSGMLRT
jgi:hypothetical protein